MRLALVLLMAAASVSIAGCLGGGSEHKRAPRHARKPPIELLPNQRKVEKRPNVVFVLTDDLSSNLVPYMPHVRQMKQRGVTFTNYYVTDSLCCPSRASILSGRLPHNTGVFTNNPPDGGFRVFHLRREERSTFAMSMRRAGYGTGLFGKYLNGYKPQAKLGTGLPYVPPGWSDWAVTGNGYPEYDYRLNTNGVVTPYAHRPRDYLTSVIDRRAVGFVKQSARAHRPFMLELATFAPHAPYTPAPRDRFTFRGLKAPEPPSFDAPNRNAPTWLAPSTPLRRFQLRLINHGFRKRVQSVQAVDRMLAHVQQALRDAGVERNTYVVFSSDNGYHMGEHRLLPGKLTAFDSDIRVPLVVTGPHVPPGKKVSKMVGNVDLAATFTKIGGTSMLGRIDGRSLMPLIHGRRVRSWRDAVLIEHHGPVRVPLDPDFPGVGAGNPISYEAIRLPHTLYVEYADGEREYYDIDRDPFERDNTVRKLSRRRRARLHAMLRKLAKCHGTRSCWAAARAP